MLNRIWRVTVLNATSVVVLAGGATGQTIDGRVASAGHPVVGATVRLLELDRAERTGADGSYAFADVPGGTYRLFVAATGYASVTDTVQLTGQTAVANIELVPSPIPLQQIIVSASPTPRPSDEQYQSAESKSRVAFDNSPGMSFAEKLSDLPGVTVRGNGSAPSRPILRGLGDNEVLVLENGLRMGDIATYDPAHATPIDALGIAQIDVVRGPATILYGPNTIGGLVNVITNIVPDASDHPLSGTVAIEGNSVSDEYSGYVNNVYSSTQLGVPRFGGRAALGRHPHPVGYLHRPRDRRRVRPEPDAAVIRPYQRGRRAGTRTRATSA